MKINFDRVRQINWLSATTKNRYSLVSVIILAGYFYFVFLAVSFVVTNVRDAFSIDNETITGQIVTFDIKSYEKVSRRFDK